MNFKTQFSYWPIYLLTVSLFLGNFIYQYAALLVILIFFLLKKSYLRYSVFVQLPLLLFAEAILSYGYNWWNGSADGYSIFFWMFSYFPPFLLMWLILSYPKVIEFDKIYSFYKILVYVESFFLISSAIQYKSFVVGDPATGTIGDANWVAFHICVVLIYETVRLVIFSKNNLISQKNILYSLVEIFYFFVVLIIPESTANLGMLVIVLSFLFFFEYVKAHLNILGIVIFLVCASIGAYILSDTIVYRRLADAVNDLREKNIAEAPYLFKINTYTKIVTGDIYNDANILIGSGPSTFTSRSSVVRMPEERVNDFPLQLPYFKSKVFEKHVSPMYAQWRISGESYGNFASPQTTFISIMVELGLLGLFIFGWFFYRVTKKLNQYKFANTQSYTGEFGQYLTLFFILNLFHLNFWEYPIVSFTYILFIATIIRTKMAKPVGEPRSTILPLTNGGLNI